VVYLSAQRATPCINDAYISNQRRPTVHKVFSGWVFQNAACRCQI